MNNSSHSVKLLKFDRINTLCKVSSGIQCVFDQQWKTKFLAILMLLTLLENTIVGFGYICSIALKIIYNQTTSLMSSINAIYSTLVENKTTIDSLFPLHDT